MQEVEIFIDTDEMKDYLFDNLIKKGLVPEEKELDEICDIFFEYLLSKGVIEEQ